MTSKQDSSIKFLELSTDKCLETFPIIFENADNHLRSAKILAENELYGNAISHLILSTEEKIKGLIIFLDAIGCKTRKIPKVQDYFKSHKSRHNLASFIIFFYDQLYKLISIKIEMRQLFPDGNIPNEKIKEIEELLNFTEHKSVSYFAQQANTAKEKGFYVDIDGNNKILSPTNISQDDYIVTYKIIEKFNDVLNEIIQRLFNHYLFYTKDDKYILLDAATAMIEYIIFIETKFAEKRKQQKKNLKST